MDHTPTLQLRIVEIDNGFLVKTGAGTYFADSPKRVEEITRTALGQFTSGEY